MLYFTIYIEYHIYICCRENLDKQLRMVRMDSLTELMAPLSDTDQAG